MKDTREKDLVDLTVDLTCPMRIPANDQPGLPEMKDMMEKVFAYLTANLTRPFESLDMEELVTARINKVKATLDGKAAACLCPAAVPARTQGGGGRSRVCGDILREAAEFTEQDAWDLQKHGYVPDKKVRIRAAAETAEAAGQYLMWSCRSLQLEASGK